MRLDSIALRSLGRRRGKLFFMVLGLSIATATVVALYQVTSVMRLELSDTFDEIGANIVVMPGEWTLSYAGITIPGAGAEGSALTNDAIIAINTIENRDNIAFVAPKVLGRLTVTSVDYNTGVPGPSPVAGRQVTVVGVDFPNELKLKRWWKYNGDKPVAVEDLMVGFRLAQELGLAPGYSMDLNGRRFRVTAVLEPQGGDEDGLVFINLLQAQDLLGMENRLSFIEVAAYCTTCPLPDIIRQIKDKLPGARVAALAEAVRARQEVVDRVTYFAYTVSALVLLVGAMVVLLTMMSSVKERTSEIGIYRAMGFRRSHVFEVILTEALLVGLFGGMTGYLLGWLLAGRLGAAVSSMPLVINWDPVVAGGSLLLAAGIGCLAGAYPAALAAGLDPDQALRSL